MARTSPSSHTEQRGGAKGDCGSRWMRTDTGLLAIPSDRSTLRCWCRSHRSTEAAAKGDPMTEDSSLNRVGHRLSGRIPVGTEIGNYRIEAYIDRGGMASVYEATDLRLNRNVALKILSQELTQGTDFRERFMRESRFAAAIDHPNIVPIYDAGEADGLLYIAMRYVRGSNLADLLSKDGPLEPRRALAILAPVADSLDTAHHAGLVHRDVKPANILLTAATGRERHEHVYLTDFGLTKKTSALTKMTATGNVVGTMAYISPEQIRGEPLDARTDLYAFGCVAYECLTGVAPFVRDDQAALLWAHLNEPPPAVSAHRPELQRADPVIARVLAKNPDNRYHTCDEFVQALTDALLDGRHSPGSVLTAAVPRPDPMTSSPPSGVMALPSGVTPTEAPAPSRAGEGQHPAATAGAVDGAADSAAERAPSSGHGWPSVPPSRMPNAESGEFGAPPPGAPPPGAPPPGAPPPGAPPPGAPPPGTYPRSGPQARPPAAGPPVVGARSRRRRRTVWLTALAALAAVATILAVVLVVRPANELVAGSGKPNGVPAA